MNSSTSNSKFPKFAIKMIGIAILACALFMAYYIIITPEYLDIFYVRFVEPRQSSLIIGDSRAAQGIVPSVMNSTHEEFHFFNYAFTVWRSPFSDLYTEAIHNKLIDNIEGQIFIICISPNQFYSNRENRVEEASTYLPSIRSYNGNGFINIQYLAYSSQQPLIFGLFNRILPTGITHRDGWLEQRMAHISPGELEERFADRVQLFRESAESSSWDNPRWIAFCELYDYLEDRNAIIVLLRIPTSEEISKSEREYYPEFNSIIEKYITSGHGIYLDHSEMYDFESIDGIHLTPASAVNYSRFLAEEIFRLYEEQL